MDPHEAEMKDVFFSCLCFSSDQKSWSVRKLYLHAMVLPAVTKRSQCITRFPPRISLDFVNATVPQCAQTDMKELCFPHRDTSNPHIMENRYPGALRQLRRLTRLNVCPNYTISYNVESGWRDEPVTQCVFLIAWDSVDFLCVSEQISQRPLP